MIVNSSEPIKEKQTNEFSFRSLLVLKLLISLAYLISESILMLVEPKPPISFEVEVVIISLVVD